MTLEDTWKKQLELLLQTYIRHSGKTETYLSVVAAGDASFFARLRGGRSTTIRRLSVVVQWFSDNWLEGVSWPDESFMRPYPVQSGTMR